MTQTKGMRRKKTEEKVREISERGKKGGMDETSYSLRKSIDHDSVCPLRGKIWRSDSSNRNGREGITKGRMRRRRGKEEGERHRRKEVGKKKKERERRRMKEKTKGGRGREERMKEKERKRTRGKEDSKIKMIMMIRKEKK